MESLESMPISSDQTCIWGQSWWCSHRVCGRTFDVFKGHHLSITVYGYNGHTLMIIIELFGSQLNQLKSLLKWIKMCWKLVESYEALVSDEEHKWWTEWVKGRPTDGPMDRWISGMLSPDNALIARIHRSVWLTVEVLETNKWQSVTVSDSKWQLRQDMGQTSANSFELERVPMTLNCAGLCGSFRIWSLSASGVLVEHQTCEKPMKKSCKLVRLTPGSGNSVGCLLSQDL